jgi:4-carboxymuconolactone decarboxylase
MYILDAMNITTAGETPSAAPGSSARIAASPPERLPPIPVAAMTDAQCRAAEALTAGRRGALRGPFVPMLRSPELLDRAQRLGEYLRFDSAIAPALRELAILITARHWAQAYEWHVHAPLAEQAGLDHRVVAELARGGRPGGMSADEVTIYEFCTELHHTRAVSDRVYVATVRLLGETGLVDLCGVCGYYSLLAMLMNVAGTPLPQGATPPFEAA